MNGAEDGLIEKRRAADGWREGRDPQPERSTGSGRFEYSVAADEAGLRLDVFLGRRPELGSRSQVAAWIRSGAVTVDGRTRSKSRLVSEGQTVAVVTPATAPLGLVAEELPVPIIYEDEWLLLVDKPAGMAVHPAPGHSSGTLVHALLGHGVSGGEEFRPGVVHRLDKDTSGLLVVAKSPEIHRKLTEMIRRREIDRCYLALVHGCFSNDSGTIEAPIARHPGHDWKFAVIAGGRHSVTHYEAVEVLRAATLLEVHLETGRTHQIRVHFLAIGHPVVGDPTYARRDPLGLGRQFLHSHRLAFLHPVTGEALNCELPLPADLEAVLGRLRSGTGGPGDDAGESATRASQSGC